MGRRHPNEQATRKPRTSKAWRKREEYLLPLSVSRKSSAQFDSLSNWVSVSRDHYLEQPFAQSGTFARDSQSSADSMLIAL